MSVRDEIVRQKDLNPRKFKTFSRNFYLLKSALRYFSVRKETSFTTSDIKDNFPLSVPAAGSSLSILKHLDVVSPRTRSSSPDRYLPKDVDMEKLEEVEEILIDSYEIDNFLKSKS